MAAEKGPVGALERFKAPGGGIFFETRGGGGLFSAPFLFFLGWLFGECPKDFQGSGSWEYAYVGHFHLVHDQRPIQYFCTFYHYVLRTTYYVLRATYYVLRTTYYVLRTAYRGN